MKKIIIALVTLILLAGAGAAGYYLFMTDNSHRAPKPPKDLSGIVVPPVSFSMKGKTFIIPNQASTSLILDLVSPTAKYDYPMGRFTSADGTKVITLTAQDDFATAIENKVQAVPIIVTEEALSNNFLAVLEGDNLDHVASLPIGQMIKIQTVVRTGNQVTVNYLVHDRWQELAEVPKIQTTAIFDIATKQIIQAGRTPASETFIATKLFVGEYLWKTTKFSDGKTVIPRKEGVFTLQFDANRISLGTDCNTGSAVYSASTGSSTSFTIEPIASTKMFCEPGQEGEYFSMMQSVLDYDEEIDGTLVFTLKDDALMTFTPKKSQPEFATTTPTN